MTPIERADRAKQLLEDPVLRGVFVDIRERLVAKLEQAPIGYVDTHHEVALTLQCLQQVKSLLHTYTQEIAIDKHKVREESFMNKMRQRIAP